MTSGLGLWGGGGGIRPPVEAQMEESVEFVGGARRDAGEVEWGIGVGMEWLGLGLRSGVGVGCWGGVMREGLRSCIGDGLGIAQVKPDQEAGHSPPQCWPPLDLHMATSCTRVARDPQMISLVHYHCTAPPPPSLHRSSDPLLPYQADSGRTLGRLERMAAALLPIACFLSLKGRAADGVLHWRDWMAINEGLPCDARAKGRSAGGTTTCRDPMKNPSYVRAHNSVIATKQLKSFKRCRKCQKVTVTGHRDTSGRMNCYQAPIGNGCGVKARAGNFIVFPRRVPHTCQLCPDWTGGKDGSSSDEGDIEDAESDTDGDAPVDDDDDGTGAGDDNGAIQLIIGGNDSAVPSRRVGTIRQILDVNEREVHGSREDLSASEDRGCRSISPPADPSLDDAYGSSTPPPGGDGDPFLHRRGRTQRRSSSAGTITVRPEVPHRSLPHPIPPYPTPSGLSHHIPPHSTLYPPYLPMISR